MRKNDVNSLNLCCFVEKEKIAFARKSISVTDKRFPMISSKWAILYSFLTHVSILIHTPHSSNQIEKLDAAQQWK